MFIDMLIFPFSLQDSFSPLVALSVSSFFRKECLDEMERLVKRNRSYPVRKLFVLQKEIVYRFLVRFSEA